MAEVGRSQQLRVRTARVTDDSQVVTGSDIDRHKKQRVGSLCPLALNDGVAAVPAQWLSVLCPCQN